MECDGVGRAADTIPVGWVGEGGVVCLKEGLCRLLATQLVVRECWSLREGDRE